LGRKFSQVNQFKKGLALAIKKEPREAVKSTHKVQVNQGGETQEVDLTGNDQINGTDDAEPDEYETMLYEVEINFRNMEEREIMALIEDELGGSENILKVGPNYVK